MHIFLVNKRGLLHINLSRRASFETRMQMYTFFLNFLPRITILVISCQLSVISFQLPEKTDN